ncbi:hypothetical protein ACQ9Y2_10230 [Pseudomonas palleroniana]
MSAVTRFSIFMNDVGLLQRRTEKIFDSKQKADACLNHSKNELGGLTPLQFAQSESEHSAGSFNADIRQRLAEIDLNNVEVRESLALKVEKEITSLQRRAQEEQLMLQEVIRKHEHTASRGRAQVSLTADVSSIANRAMPRTGG